MDMAMRAKKILRFAKISLKMVIFTQFDAFSQSEYIDIET